MIDVERLKHDRDYWDSVAVEGATHFYPNGWSENWYRQDGAGIYCWLPSYKEWAKSHNHTAGKFIPRPTRKQWSGPEDGLPPVGEDCEYYDCENGWVLTHILSHHPNGDCAWHQSVRADGFVDGRSFSTDGAHSFRPLKTEKDRVVEAAMKIGGLRARDGAKEVYAALYDAGFLKMPEGGG